ncbi:MAG: prolyl oligopeptidase family serine peptidase [Micromonosporaceae bacterium]
MDPWRASLPRPRPRTVAISDDGARVTYLRPAYPGDPYPRLWVWDVTSGVQRAVAGTSGVERYATDTACRIAAFTADGVLHRVSIDGGGIERLPTGGPAHDAWPDPSGRRLAYLTRGTLRVIDEHGADQLLAGEAEAGPVMWGESDPASRTVFGRHEGYWWSPDSERLLAARVDHSGALPVTSLHLLDLDGFWVDVRWDRQAYPHLVAVTWEPRGGPLITVLPRSQHHALVLAVDARTGETQVHAELDDPRWVTVTPGTPAYLPDGRVVLGGELTLDALDTRCLFADGTLLTPPQLYVHRLAGRMPVDPALGEHLVDLVVEASEGEPAERHVYRVRLAARTVHPEVTRLTGDAGWHTGYAAGGTIAVLAESLDHPGVRLTVHRGDRTYHVPEPPSTAEPDPYPPRPVFERVTDRRLPAAVLYPADHVAGRRLPVLVEVPVGQGVVATREAWLRRRWYAERGLAVVVIDGRGTPGVAPSFEKAIYRRVLDILLADQAEGLAALTAKHPDLDTERVAIRGTGLAGAVAAAAVLRHPELYRAGVADAPITDWRSLPPGYAERFLGTPEDNPEAYARHDLAAEAAELRRPLLLTYPPGTAAEAQAVRLAGALTDADRPYQTFPTPTDRSADVLEYEWEFIRRALWPESGHMGGSP